MSRIVTPPAHGLMRLRLLPIMRLSGKLARSVRESSLLSGKFTDCVLAGSRLFGFSGQCPLANLGTLVADRVSRWLQIESSVLFTENVIKELA